MIPAELRVAFLRLVTTPSGTIGKSGKLALKKKRASAVEADALVTVAGTSDFRSNCCCQRRGSFLLDFPEHKHWFDEEDHGGDDQQGGSG